MGVEGSVMKIPSAVRHFNKRFLNHLTGRIARSAHGPFAMIVHAGRRSGKAYQTPIMVFPVEGGFMIALTYGPEVDWYRNIMAAGRCQVLRHGRVYDINKIEPVSRESALPHFPRFERAVLGLLGIRDFIYLASTGNGHR